VVVSTQAPPQFVLPAGQVQLPPTHVAPPMHVVPQAPQLVELVFVLTHEPLHGVVPAAHIAWH
jgi:hypothetical protein